MWQATTGVTGLRTALGAALLVFCGVACSLAPKTPCVTCPLPLCGTLAVSTTDDGDGDDEHPLPRKRTMVQGIIATGIDTGSQDGLLQMRESEGSWGAHTHRGG